MISRFINALFAITIVLTLLLDIILLSNIHADETKAKGALRKTTVMVNGLSCSGSGSFVHGQTGKVYLLTNAHVCNCARYKGRLYATRDNGELIVATQVKLDWGSDLCAAEVKGSRGALDLAPQLLPLSTVYTRGYPGGRLTESMGTVRGNVEWDFDIPIQDMGYCPKGSLKELSLNGNFTGCRLHFVSTLTSLYARPGSSGSPVVNIEGRLVGVLSSFMPEGEYDAGMVSFSALQQFMSTL